MSAKIKFPDEHYIGLITSRSSRDNGKDELPLAFMTPEGTDAAAVKRKETVDRWIENNKKNNTKPLPTTTIKNEPIGGFKLIEKIQHYSRNGGNVKWRIEDPRGFELEISSSNLMDIFGCTVVDCGEILDQCIWARDGSENVLVPVTSETYIQAVANTSRMNKTASLKDLKAGDRVVLYNGTEGRYYGKFHTVGLSYRSHGLEISKKKKYVIVEKLANKETVVHVLTTPKLSSIIPDTEILPADGMRMLNEMDHGWFSLNDNVHLVSTETEGVLPTQYRSAACIAQLDGQYWEVNFNSFRATQTFKLTQIKTDPWVNNLEIDPVGSHTHYSMYGSRLEKMYTEAEFKLLPYTLQGRVRDIVFEDGMVKRLSY